MGKFIVSILFFVISVTLFFTTTVQADSVAGRSASIQPTLIATPATQSSEVKIPYALKRITIKKMLEKYNSPMAKDVDSFISACTTYKIDCYLLPSITGLESSFGQFTAPNTYNPFGWGGGYIQFKNWDEAIHTVAKGLRENYMNKGAESVEQIAPIYAASKTWAPRVRSFMEKFQNEEEKNQLYFTADSVQL